MLRALERSGSRNILGEMSAKTIDDALASFDLNKAKISRIKDLMQEEMKKGLASEGGSVLKMLPTYVHSTPDGTEEGDFLALDLGGTNFRVLKVTLKDRKYEQVEAKASLPDEVMTTTGERLFDHIAEQVAQFSAKHGLSRSLPLGFTFSFPVQQFSLTSGNLIRWTKKFTASGVEGKDVVLLLKEAFDRRKDVDVDVVALVNDTTGTMMARALVDANCCAGLILGTGTNACYMEKLANVGKWKENKDKHDSVIVNMEWGAFGDGTDGKLDQPGALEDFLTGYDRQLDKESSNSGRQRFEKMISGMYLGEIVRLALVSLAENGLAFDGKAGKLSEKGSFETAYLSIIEDSSNADHNKTKEILSKLGIPSTPDNCQLVLRICCAVSTRAARLSGAGVVAIAEKIGQIANSVVAVDGSVFQLHPHFKNRMLEVIKELLPDNGIRLERAEDGSGRGAALVAAVACRMKKEK